MIKASTARERTDKKFMETHLEELNIIVERAVDEGNYECYKYYPAKLAGKNLFKKLVDGLKKKGYEVSVSEPDCDNEVKVIISWYEWYEILAFVEEQ